ncbi:F0F1 ATP synthase subunit B family protein [[Mycoplasma] gypis]|uniref:ATP synthase subunit b n=1 Tax=[Mycoplasma] gypis TaxID=92404 RepID=A0ABZ2RNE7_9BACT|nr:ATP synthase F0 subunit B [[Mycoplasma] gypis]MBN0919372.1 ATP synthase F0 subunit B [[Mycoplasma] gypis]
MNSLINEANSVSVTLGNQFKAFSWSWPYFIVTIVSLAIITIILTFLVYRPVKKMLAKRQEFIQKNIDETVKAKEDALQLQNKANESLLETYKRVDKMLNDARVDSEKIIDDSTEVAKIKAHSMIEQANNSITKSWRDFEKQQKTIIVENAVEIAKKILGREIKDEESKKYIQQLLDEAK